MFLDIEEAVFHLVRLGVKKEDLKLKVIQNQLIKYPTSLQVYQCDYCAFFVHVYIFRDSPATFATSLTATRSQPCSTYLTPVESNVVRRRGRPSSWPSAEVRQCFIQPSNTLQCSESFSLGEVYFGLTEKMLLLAKALWSTFATNGYEVISDWWYKLV